MHDHKPFLFVAATWLALACSGCAHWRMPEPEIPDIKPIRKERAADVIESFEKHRNEAEYQAAKSFWKQGQRDQAVTSLESLTRRSPTHVAGQQLLMEILLVQGKVDRAAVVADSTASLDDARIWHARGLVYDTLGRREEAWKCLETAVKLEPRNENYLASLKALDEVNRASAETTVASDEPAPRPTPNKVTATATMAPTCVLLSAEMCLAMGRYEEARQRLESLASQPEYAAEVETLVRRIASSSRSRAPAVAVSTPPAAPRRLPTAAAPQFASKIGTGLEPQKLTVVRTSAEVEAPATISSPQTYLQQAGQALAESHLDTATVFLRKARELAPQDESLALSAAVLPLRHEEYELARDIAQEALRNFPQSAGLYRILGISQYRLGRWPAARDALHHAITLDNRDGLSYFLMGCTLNKLGQTTEAEPYLRQAQTLDRRYATETKVR